MCAATRTARAAPTRPAQEAYNLLPGQGMQRVEQSMRVKAPVHQVYHFWRNFENFPRFMVYVEEVRCLESECRTSHWKLRGPLGKDVEYDAELTQDMPDKAIGWNSRGGDIQTSGNVTFAEQDDNTLVHVIMQWASTPGGAVGEALSRMLQHPEQMLQEDLQRFKDITEGRVGSGLRR
jgi:uncharacterized membrane protein